MPRAIVGDIPLTTSYIPKVSETPEISPTFANFYKPIEDRCIHKGRVVDQFTTHLIILIVVFPIFECVDSNCTIKNKFVTLIPNQVLTKEVREYLKRWEELIRENVFSLGGHLDHLSACLSYILYCILAEQQYNLAYFFVKRIKSAKATPKSHLPCGMFLTRLFRYVIKHYPHLDNGNVVDRVMRPLALIQTRRPQSDHGILKVLHSVSSSSTHHIGSSSHQKDDDNDEGTSQASTPSPNSYLNYLLPLTHQTYNIPTSSEQTF
nr:ribosomal protein L7Ae/L30e/S12e/Gadd45 [Tanacetum cinerariifolium]